MLDAEMRGSGKKRRRGSDSISISYASSGCMRSYSRRQSISTIDRMRTHASLATWALSHSIERVAVVSLALNESLCAFRLGSAPANSQSSSNTGPGAVSKQSIAHSRARKMLPAVAIERALAASMNDAMRR